VKKTRQGVRDLNSIPARKNTRALDEVPLGPDSKALMSCRIHSYEFDRILWTYTCKKCGHSYDPYV
jgi:hypothetical protein